MTGWANTPRGRKELAAVGLFCLAFAVVPLLTTELYPFSRAPMFADAPQQYCEYAVITPDDRLTDTKDLIPFGLQRNYWGNPLGVGVGFKPPPTVDDFGKVARLQQVIEEVTPRLRQFPQWESVAVEQSLIGAMDPNPVGVVQKTVLQVRNPYYQAGGP